MMDIKINQKHSSIGGTMSRNYLQINSYRSLLQEELTNLNKVFNSRFSFKLGDPGYSFNNVYPDNVNMDVYWAKVFVLNDENVQIGRITYRFELGEMKSYYVKQYKPIQYEYDSNDDIFYMLKFYFAKQPMMDIKLIVNAARQIQIFEKAKVVIWRIQNPVKVQKKITKSGNVWRPHRKKIQGKNLRVIIDKLVDSIVNKTENPFVDFTKYLVSLGGKQSNTADMFLHLYK